MNPDIKADLKEWEYHFLERLGMCGEPPYSGAILRMAIREADAALDAQNRPPIRVQLRSTAKKPVLDERKRLIPMSEARKTELFAKMRTDIDRKA